MELRSHYLATLTSDDFRPTSVFLKLDNFHNFLVKSTSQ